VFHLLFARLKLMKIIVSMLFVYCVRAKEAGGLDVVGVNYHGRVPPDLILQEFLGHFEELVKVHGISVPHVGLNFLLGF